MDRTSGGWLQSSEGRETGESVQSWCFVDTAVHRSIGQLESIVYRPLFVLSCVGNVKKGCEAHADGQKLNFQSRGGNELKTSSVESTFL